MSDPFLAEMREADARHLASKTHVVVDTEDGVVYGAYTPAEAHNKQHEIMSRTGHDDQTVLLREMQEPSP